MNPGPVVWILVCQCGSWDSIVILGFQCGYWDSKGNPGIPVWILVLCIVSWNSGVSDFNKYLELPVWTLFVSVDLAISLWILGIGAWVLEYQHGSWNPI